MRLGLVTPVLTRHPEHDAPWTEDAGPTEVAAIARAADGLGYHHVTCSEHVAVPASAAATRGTRYYDPLRRQAEAGNRRHPCCYDRMLVSRICDRWSTIR
jgi:alkanesulfonate monooxygenase SsuD/methylene tetrahydromethanopterin reductase-like flavin-dependent oxidoreductase (luciferase family)